MNACIRGCFVEDVGGGLDEGKESVFKCLASVISSVGATGLL